MPILRTFDIPKILSYLMHTNGAIALVNVNAGRNTQVYYSTSEKVLSYKLEQDQSVTFWVENNYTYEIYCNSSE